MHVTLAAYVTIEKQEGNTFYVCRPTVEANPVVRDPLLRVALQRLANKAKQRMHQWIERGNSEKLPSVLYDPTAVVKKLKLTLVLRDRTVQWKLLFIIRTVLGRTIAYSPSLPDLWFDLDSVAGLEERAIEVYTQWCNEFLGNHRDAVIPDLSIRGDAWIEPVDLELSSLEKRGRRSQSALASLFGSGKMRGDEELAKVGRCLDELSADFGPAIGRDYEVELLERFFQRSDQQPILLVGPSGSGKSAIIEHCVQLRSSRNKENRRRGSQTWLISPQRLISGMSYLGQWEERWLSILKEATRKDHILYLDDLLGLLSAGVTRDSNLSAADVLKSYLAQYRVRLVGEITPEALGILRRRDRALADCFHRLPIGAMNEDQTLSVLQRIAADVEADRSVFFHPSIPKGIVETLRTLVPHQAFPGKGVEVIKNLARWGHPTIDRYHLMDYLRQSTGVSQRMIEPRSETSEPLRSILEHRVISQPRAIAAVERIAHRACFRLSPADRPHGVLLFLGPTGVGKTECAKALNAALFADDTHLLRFDMNEITTSLAAEKLIGTFDEPDGRLTSAVRRRPYCVLLLDEIEKAHPDVFDYLLQVLGEGRLTDARGRTIDFRNTVIIMTSNLGSQEDQSNLGFESGSEETSDRQASYERAAQRFFRPEFYNRIDEVVVFQRLGRADVSKIANLQLGRLLARDGMARRDIFVRVQPDVLEWVIDRGFDRFLGARAIKRAIESHLVQPLSDLFSKTTIDRSFWACVSLLPAEERQSDSKSPIDCLLQPLEIVKAKKEAPAPSLSSWLEMGEQILQEYSQRLVELQGKMGDGNRHQDRLRYYALHDHVFRCREFFKQLKEASADFVGPSIEPMQSNPAAVKKGSNQRAARERRRLMDYHSELDIHEAIADSADARGTKRSLDEGVQIFRRSAMLTQSLLQHSDRPIHWFLEWRFLTETPFVWFPMEGRETENPRTDRLQLPVVPGGWGPITNPAGAFLVAISNTLQDGFQYDVQRSPTNPYRLKISGIGVSGLLEALIGTYRLDGESDRGLGLLIACEEKPDSIEPRNESSWNPRSDPCGDLTFDWTYIRGSLSNEVHDFATDRKISFAESRQQWACWWNELLPSVLLGS